MKTNQTAICFTLCLAFVPLITMYASPIPGITLGELALVFFWGVFVIESRLKVSMDSCTNKMLLFTGYIIISFLVTSLVYGFYSNALIRMVRYSFYYITGCFLVKKWVDYELLTRWIVRIGKIATCFIFLQYISYYVFGHILDGKVPFLPLYHNEYLELDYKTLYENLFRPTSFFLEPAHYAQFTLLALVIALWKDRHIWGALFLTAGLIYSTSAQGIVVAAVTWIIFAFYKISHFRFNAKQVLFGLGAGALVIGFTLWVTRQQVFLDAVGRLSSLGKASAIYARMGVLEVIIETMTPFSAIFGHGFGNVIEGNWTTPGLGYVLYGSGIVGLILLLIYLLYAWRRGGMVAKSTVVIFLFMLVQSGVIMHIQMILYMALMQMKREEECLQKPVR